MKTGSLVPQKGDPRANLCNIVYPSQSGGHKDIHHSGWHPVFFNQQWGGAPILGGLDGDLCMDYATGYNESKGAYAMPGYDANRTYYSMSFKVSNTQTIAAVWLKIGKAGNPTGNLQVSIYSDNADKPNAAIVNGAATAQAGTLHTSAGGKWERFVFATPPSLTANTKYHIVLSRSDAVSSTNYWIWEQNYAGVASYPFGNICWGDATPTWTTKTYQGLFAVEPTAAYRFLQPSGAFDYKLVGCEGSPLNQSYGLCAKLKDIRFSPYEFTWKGTFTDLAVSKPFAEFLYGDDHDRISLSCDSDGHVNLLIYEADGTLHTIAGTTDVHSGTYDIGVYVRAKGDGADIATLYVNGVAEDSHTSLTLTFNYAEFRELGTGWLLGGFPAAPTWTNDYTCTALPTAASPAWTYDGTATEAAHAVVSGGKLYIQIVGSTDVCSWHIHPTLDNANGFNVAIKIRAIKGFDTVADIPCTIRIQDGTKGGYITFNSYFVDAYGYAANHKYQIDLTKQDHVFLICWKGSDALLLCNGKVIMDLTGLLSNDATADAISFGDMTATAGGNTESVWDYIKYYETAAILPQFTSGSLSEAALWSGDMRFVLPMLYNDGTRMSAKKLCGLTQNYVERILQTVKQEGITSGPTTASTSPVLLTDMEAFAYGESMKVSFDGSFYNDTSAKSILAGICVDGKITTGLDDYRVTDVTATNEQTIAQKTSKSELFGLHKIEVRWYVSANNGVASLKRRKLIITEV